MIGIWILDFLNRMVRVENTMRLKVLITRKIFDEVIAFVKSHFEVDDNQSDISFPPNTLIQRLQKKAGAIILLTDRIDEAVLSQCPDLKIVCNIAGGYKKIYDLLR